MNITDHKKCGFSTGIDGFITAGQGNLDNNGFWEFPCGLCLNKHCYNPNCLKPTKFTFANQGYCSNKCVRKVHGRVKLSPASFHQYTIATGNDNTIIPHHTDRTLQLLGKAILKLSKKPVKPLYVKNEGALPKEWR